MALEQASTYHDGALSKARKAYCARIGTGQYVSGAVSETISRADDALGWPLLVQDDTDIRALMLCAHTRAFGSKIAGVCP